MVKSARHTDGVGLNYFFPGLFLIYFLIISLFFEKMRGVKKGGPEERGRGGWVQVLSTSVSNDSTKFFFPVIGSQLYFNTQVLLQIYFCFLGKEL